MEEKYQEILTVAKKDYYGIGVLMCPVLDYQKVLFTKEGFKHFIFKGRMLRPENEQVFRFNLIRHIKAVITNKNSKVLESRHINKTIYIAIENSGIKVILRKTKSSTIIFVSVMKSNKKSR